MLMKVEKEKAQEDLVRVYNLTKEAESILHNIPTEMRIEMRGTKEEFRKYGKKGMKISEEVA